MKKFEYPEIEVKKFAVEDIMVYSIGSELGERDSWWGGEMSTN